MRRRDFIRAGAVTGASLGAIGSTADPLLGLLTPRSVPTANGEVRLNANETRFDIGDFASYFRAFCAMALEDPQYGYTLRQYLANRPWDPAPLERADR